MFRTKIVAYQKQRNLLGESKSTQPLSNKIMANGKERDKFTCTTTVCMCVCVCVWVFFWRGCSHYAQILH